MSVFVDIVRYDDEGPDGGNALPITPADLQSAVKKLSGYKLLKEEGEFGIQLGGVQAVAVLEEGVLSCRYDMVDDGDKLIKALRKLAAQFPGAVVEDEDGNVV